MQIRPIGIALRIALGRKRYRARASRTAVGRQNQASPMNTLQREYLSSDQ